MLLEGKIMTLKEELEQKEVSMQVVITVPMVVMSEVTLIYGLVAVFAETGVRNRRKRAAGGGAPEGQEPADQVLPHH